jgi:hypothetical protein
MVYFALAMALFADDDYEEVAARLAGTLSSWGCWDARWGPPTSGGITRARERLGFEPLRDTFAQVAVPVADQLTRGAFLGAWRLMSIDGFEWDAPDTPGNAAAFGYAGSGTERSPFPKVRVVTVSECASHAVVDAEAGGIAGKGAGEQSLARRLYARLAEDWLLIADRNFYNWADWCAAADAGAALLWRVKSDLRLPVLELLPDGSYRPVLISPKITGKARERLIEAARAGDDLDPGRPRRRCPPSSEEVFREICQNNPFEGTLSKHDFRRSSCLRCGPEGRAGRALRPGPGTARGGGRRPPRGTRAAEPDRSEGHPGAGPSGAVGAARGPQPGRDPDRYPGQRDAGGVPGELCLPPADPG